jgi:hypothetical protein
VTGGNLAPMESMTESASAVEAASREPVLVFIHIPKAAGTTLGRILRHHYPGGAYDDGANAFTRLEQAEAHLAAAAAKADMGAISGEITFGLAARFPVGARVVSILRDPVERTLSQYYYFRRAMGRGLVPPWLPPPPGDLSLEQCLEEGGYILDNLQTRMLCGLVSPYDPLPPDALERAKDNLRQRLAYVGTTERFDEFLALLNLELGWPTLPYRRARVYRRSPERQSATAAGLRLVEEHNALDRELHAFAGELLDRSLARAGPELELELEVLREALGRWHDAQAEGRAASAPRAARSLPVAARVELALKEAELATALRKEAKKLVSRTAELRELERRLETPSLKARFRRLSR